MQNLTRLDQGCCLLEYLLIICLQFFFIIIIIIIIIIILLLWEFFTPVLAGGFTLEFKWQQISLSLKTLLSILADPNNPLI